MRIESPRLEETGIIADLWVELARGQQRFGSHLASEPNRGRIAETIGRYIADETLLVARSGDAVVGFVMFAIERRLYTTAVTRGIVHNLFIAPEKRAEGIGTALMDAAEAALIERGADVLGLETLARNDAARRFYVNRGYEPHRVELEKRVETDNTP
jgi:ribosomal protein S18 acetylase RimI-like enzyme